MFDVESWLAGEIALEFAKAEGAAFISGNGTEKPQGFLSGTPVATADGARAFGVLEFVASAWAAAWN
jgi:HK97 family phage major capsid protein